MEQTERGIGLELFEYKISMVLIDDLNDEIDRQQELWSDRDETWNAATGKDGSVILEYIDPDHIYRGQRPSLIESQSVDDFPNLSVMAYQARPTNDLIDQATNYSIIIDIESFIKGESESETNSRMHRTSEAVHQVLVKNEKLGGLSMGWDNDPLVQLTDLFKRKEQTSSGEDWFWQGTRLRYSLTRHTRLPSNL